MKSMTRFLSYTSYLNSIIYHINHVLLLTTTELSKLLTFYLTTIKNHVIKFCDKVYERNGTNLFCSIEVLNKLKSKDF